MFTTQASWAAPSKMPMRPGLVEACCMLRPFEAGLEDSGGATKVSFGHLLREHRLKAGFSQEYLADRARMSVQAVSALERGTRAAPYRSTVELLAIALGLSLDQRAQFDAVAERARQRGIRQTGLVRNASHNLPVQVTSFVGREVELERLAELLSTNRLITITGPGGIGKTRIALEAAVRHLQRHAEDVCFVDLSSLTDGRFVASKIAQSVQPPVMGGDGSTAWLSTVLKSRRILLILDNCEHIIDDVVDAARVLLQTCPMMKILPTSREVLSLNGEVVLRLPPLTVPEGPITVGESAAYSALELFRERASTATSDLRWDAGSVELAIDICRRLDGIPLAVELVAACLPALGLRDLSARLSDASLKPAVRRDLPARQQTMAATIKWSYDLLNRSEQVFFRRLAIFAGNWTLEAADFVCSDGLTAPNSSAGLLSSLVDKSLVGVMRRDGTTRYGMFETVRAYGLAQLEAQQERTSVAGRHALWLCTYADTTPRFYLEMPSMPVVVALQPELDNIRAALEWTLGSTGELDIVLGGRILAGLRALWIWSGRLAELRSWTESALERIDEHRYPDVAGALRWGLLQTLSGDAMLEAAQRAVELLEDVGDRRNAAAVHLHLAYKHCRSRSFINASRSAQQALEHIDAENWRHSIVFATYLNIRALLCTADGSFDRARADIADAESLARSLGDEHFITMWCQYLRAETEFCAGNISIAAEIAERMLYSEHAPAADRVAFHALSCLATFYLALGDGNASRLAARNLLNRARNNDPRKVVLAIGHLAAFAAHRGELRLAARLKGFVDSSFSGEDFARTPVEQSEYDRLTATIGQFLDQELLARLLLEGAALSIDEAAAEALTL